ncbi:MAG: T9SS type A sorting domain-containing protein [Bacteroidota bacterium]
MASLYPCIDAGTVTSAPAVDLDGNMRNAIPDIGAYENTTVSIEEITQPGISIFPNPAQNEISIVNSSVDKKIKLYDVEGRLIHIIQTTPSGKTVINISKLNRGYYFLTSDNISFQKFGKM